MAQISKGDTFVDGQQVTGTRLNQLVDSSVLLVGAITDQPNITANTLEATDSTIVNDAGVLKEATIGDILNSGLDTTFDVCTNETTVTSALNGKTNKDINVTPNDGVLVTGKSFTSVDGITATVTSIAHGLESNTCLNISASNAVYSGQYFITVISVDSFSYVIRQTTPVAASGTLDYTKKGTVKVVGSEHLSGNLEVVGKTELKGSTIINGSSTFEGTSNFTGTLQVNGTVGYVLTEIVEQSMSYSGSPASGSWTNCFTSASYIKPAGEIWVLEVDFRFRTQASVSTAIRFNQTSTTTTLNGVFNIEGAGADYFHTENAFLRYVVSDATTFTSTFTLDVQPSVSGYVFTVGETTFAAGTLSGITLPVSKFRIYKYKTA